MKRGLVLGKFMPPHQGHVLLCRTAQALVDRLTILVCSLPDDPIPGLQRAEWMRALFLDCRVVHHDAVVPQAPEDSADFWPIWREIVTVAHPDPIDLVFASETYGTELASQVGARFVPVDPDRDAVPVSASAIRTDPVRNWRYIPDEVRHWYRRRICLHGPESTGKSELAKLLAAHFGSIAVPEYGRTYCEHHGTDLDSAQLLEIAKVQQAMVEAAAPMANHLLILDTDPLMTAVWYDMMGVARDPWFAAFDDYADLYLLCDVDLPWIDDGTRIFGDVATRQRFFEACRAELVARGVNWVPVSGSGAARLANALAAIAAHSPDKR